jgi:1,2-phenylacetyl-CoA epoxidase PaaB subunit
VVPAGQLWSGVPAVFVRTRTPEEIAQATEFVQADRELAQVYVAVSNWQATNCILLEIFIVRY